MAFAKGGRAVILGLLLSGLITAILLPGSPLQQNVPQRDSGVFLYIGQQILEGRVPYRDVWDHKGPAIYYLNAAGLFLASGSRWGVWWVQWLMLNAAAVLGYQAFRQMFGVGPALTASLVWLVSLTLVVDGGNYTEEYALTFQFAALYLFSKLRLTDKPTHYTVAFGLTWAAVFWMRSNLIGLHASLFGVVFASHVFSRRYRQALNWVVASVAGFLLGSLPVLGYFVGVGAWGHLTEAVFHYNSLYVTATGPERWEAMLEGLKTLTPSGLTFSVVMAWAVAGASLLAQPRPTGVRASQLGLAVLGLPVELVLASASGRTYSHYYMAWLPLFAFLTAMLVSDFLDHFASGAITVRQRTVKLNSVWLLAALFAMLLSLHQTLVDPIAEVRRGEFNSTSPVVKSIWKYTDQGDYLLMWGAEAKYNFMAGRPAPSRFIYQYPLYTCGYVTEAMITEFLLDIARTKPLIIDASASNSYVPPLDADERARWSAPAFAGKAAAQCELPSNMADVFAFIASHYRVVGEIRSKHWPIYEYANAP